MSLNNISWLFSFIALYGTWLNVNEKRTGFYFWLISNTAFALINYVSGNYALAFLFTCYVFLTIKGLKTWQK